MAIYWVDISVDNIPNYQENDSNFPMGWEDYKTVRQTINYQLNILTYFLFKGIRMILIRILLLVLVLVKKFLNSLEKIFGN